MKPMLAATVDNLDQLKKRFPLYASPKLDGIRVLILGGKVVSRNLKPIPNQFVQKTLQRELDLNELDGLDGELIVGDPADKDCFRRTTSGVMSVEGNPDFVFWVFDKYDVASFDYRHRLVRQIVKYLKHERVKPVPHVKVEDAWQVTAYEELMLSRGFEGIMLRCPQGLYKQGRSTMREGHLMKLKRFADSEATITGFDERMHNANEKTTDNLGRSKRSSHKANKHGMATLGALQVKDIVSGVSFDIGTGFDDKLRQEIWDNPTLYVGKLVKYKYFPSGSKDKPRFPVFLGFREDL